MPQFCYPVATKRDYRGNSYPGEYFRGRLGLGVQAGNVIGLTLNGLGQFLHPSYKSIFHGERFHDIYALRTFDN